MQFIISKVFCYFGSKNLNSPSGTVTIAPVIHGHIIFFFHLKVGKELNSVNLSRGVTSAVK